MSDIRLDYTLTSENEIAISAGATTGKSVGPGREPKPQLDWGSRRARLRRARHKREEPSRKRKVASGDLPTVAGTRRTAWDAIASGGEVKLAGSLVRAEWDVAKHCERPYVRTKFASTRGYTASPAEKAGPMTGVSVSIATPCRRCEKCLAQRRRLWSARARQETRESPETWFGTLTFRNDLQIHWLSKLREDAYADGVDFDRLTVDTQFGRRLGLAAVEARKFIASLRKTLPAPVLGGKRVPNWRYLLIAERHHAGSDDSRPHFHMLLHSIHMDFNVPLEYWPGIVRYPGDSPTWPGVLEKLWEPCGFSKWRRVTPENCTYLCKYLAKDSNNRVRASLDYGAFDYGAIRQLTENALLHSDDSKGWRSVPGGNTALQIIPQDQPGPAREGTPGEGTGPWGRNKKTEVDLGQDIGTVLKRGT